MNVTLRDEGLSLLSKSPPTEPPIADLVFIHGIQGHPWKTWTHPKTISKSKPEGTYWPRDLLSIDFPNVRVLTYGYDSQVSRFFAATNQSGIFAHGQKFLRALKRERQEAPKRPLIFLAHSLGGIITKEALHQAQESKDEMENNILLSTHAVVFFGTPHRGSPYANMGQVVERAAKIMFSTNSKILGNLGPDGEMLERVRMDFARMLDEHKLKAYSFQEAKGLSGIKFFSKKVVENSSSSIDHASEKTEEINANHNMMCKFEGSTDEGYVQVKGVIADYLQEITTKLSTDEEKLLNACLRSLYSPAINQRRESIEPAEPHTFEWIFTENDIGFTKWLAGDGTLLWIKGKPGAGKSTLLKYIYENETTVNILKRGWTSNVAIASFFFYDQTNDPQWRSFDGLLRALLYEMLLAVPELFKGVVDVFQALRRDPDPVWERVELVKVISTIGKQQDVEGCICLFMDALDEYPGDCKEIVRNMKHLLDSFANGNYRLKICASSRPMNEFEVMLPRFAGFTQIAIHDWTLADITTIVSNRLQEADRGDMPLLSREIISKANGSFVWVKLVLKSLSAPLFHFESEDELLDRLSELPNDLEMFYKHLVQKIPEEIRPKMWMVLQLMFCSAGREVPLTLAEISLAVKLTDGSELWATKPSLFPTDDLRRCQQLKISLEACLGAFIEIDRWKCDQLYFEVPKWVYKPLTDTEYELTMSRLRFSHKTARDFILSSSASEAFHSDVAVDYGFAGHTRLCKMYTILAEAPHAIFYLLDLDCLPFGIGKTSINHFETELMVFWGIHAREAEYLEYASFLGQVPQCHNTYDATLLTDKNKYLFRHPPYERAVDAPNMHKVEPARIVRVSSFNIAVTASMGTDWVQKWAEQWRDGIVAENWSSPPSILAFALLNGLFLYVRDVVNFDTKHPLDNPSPPLLFWAIASCDFFEMTTRFGILRDEADRCNKFVHYLLQRGANPNITFRIPYAQTPPDKPLILKRPLRSGHADITLLNFALGILLKMTDEDNSSELRIAMEELICILVENGATVGNTLYTNYWKQRLEPSERTLLHYLCFPRDYKKTYENGIVLLIQPFIELDEGPIISRTITTLLDHGADPNAVDSSGLDVLSCMILGCPYDLIEYALLKGALISPLLIHKSGLPIDKRGILREDRWKRPECYTPEARELVRKNMPHWKDMVDGQPVEEPPAVEERPAIEERPVDDVVEHTRE